MRWPISSFRPTPWRARRTGTAISRRDKGESFPPWYYWLAAHALVHGGVVFVVTGSAVLALVEVILHSAIDYAKCERWIGFHQDQALHVLCKVGYCFFV